MPSVTTWFRLEPHHEDTDVATGLAARLHDPLWLLGRQWQVGEFQGEDAGSPVVARWRGLVAPIRRYHPERIPLDTEVTAGPYDASVPLETQVERQPVARAGAVPGLRLAVETGQHFLRLLRLQPLSADPGAAFVRVYPVPALTEAQREQLDPETVAYADLMAGRALDGRRLRAALGPDPDQPRLDAALEIASADRAEVTAACRAWLSWSAGLFSEPAPGARPWQPDRLEYAFTVSTRLEEGIHGERPLTAESYDEGTLDWHSFDLNLQVSAGARSEPPGEVLTRTVVPAPVSFHGMPALRFWELEDARVDLGALQPGATDLPSLLLVDTLSGFGNDWYVIPVDLPVGTLATTRSLVVTDTFGVRTLRRPVGDANASRGGWSMFSLAFRAGPGGLGHSASNLFFLPPTLVRPMEGPVLEEVALVRDELANLAWAVERRLESPLEVGVDTRRDVGPISPQPEPGGLPSYRLASPVPPHWVPLIPVQLSPGSSEVRLARGAVLNVDGDSTVVTAEAQLLDGGSGSRLLIHEEEVPREGMVVRRAYQAARGHDGRLFVWAGNRSSVGQRGASSGLSFDDLER